MPQVLAVSWSVGYLQALDRAIAAANVTLTITSVEVP